MVAILLSVPGRLKVVADNVATLLSRLTATRAGYLDAAVSSAIKGVKSVQRGSVTLDALSVNVTISSVTTSKALLSFTQTPAYTTAAGDALNFRSAFMTAGVRGWVANSTTLTFSRGLTPTGATNVIAWQVVEYD